MPGKPGARLRNELPLVPEPIRIWSQTLESVDRLAENLDETRSYVARFAVGAFRSRFDSDLDVEFPLLDHIQSLYHSPLGSPKEMTRVMLSFECGTLEWTDQCRIANQIRISRGQCLRNVIAGVVPKLAEIPVDQAANLASSLGVQRSNDRYVKGMMRNR